MTKRRRVISILAASFMAGAAGGGSAAAAPERPSDPQIIEMLIVGGQLEVDYANIALANSEDKNVRMFAEHMVKDHSHVVDSTADLAKRLKMSGEESAISLYLMKTGAMNMQKLRSLSGNDFDRFYIENEVKFHRVVIDTTEKVLAPSAQNPELRSAVLGWLPMYRRHENHALTLQASRAMAAAEPPPKP